MDLSLEEAERKTRLSKRSLRDVFFQIRERMVMGALDEPQLFGGFGDMALDQDGSINKHVLDFWVHYSKSKGFKKRMHRLYPRTNIDRDAVLLHVIEVFIRKFAKMAVPDITPEFKLAVARSFEGAEHIVQHVLSEVEISPEKQQQHCWSFTQALIKQALSQKTRYHRQAQHELIIRDLKKILRKKPL